MKCKIQFKTTLVREWPCQAIITKPDETVVIGIGKTWAEAEVEAIEIFKTMGHLPPPPPEKEIEIP
jgi:hypothetical protein